MGWGVEKAEFLKVVDTKGKGENIIFEGSMSNKNLVIIGLVYSLTRKFCYLQLTQKI